MKKGTFKRVASLILALVTVVALCPMMPAVAEAAEEVPTMATDVCPCCGKAFSSISWTSSGYLNRDLSKAGHYKLSKAFTASKEFAVSGNVTVDLNGYLLKAASGKRLFTVQSGGVLTILNSGGDNGRLQGLNTSSDGGTVYVEEGGTVNFIGGRIVGLTTTYAGGAIYNAGTFNIAGGTVDTGKTSGVGGGNIYNVGTLTIYDGTVKGGATTGGGKGANIFSSGTLNVYGGLISGGESNGDNGYGGNIYSSGTLIIKDGTVQNGTSQDHGGNLFVGTGSTFHMYGGTLTGGKAMGYGSSVTGYGGNIYATGADTDVKIYGGTITGGQNTVSSSYGGNVFGNGGVQIYMYGGTISYGVASNGSNVYMASNATLADDTKQYSAFYMLGGTIIASQTKDLSKGTDNVIIMYNGRYSGSVDISGFVADCCCCTSKDDGYVMFNPGYEEGTCTDCLYAQAAAEGLTEDSGGGHNFQSTGENTYTCSGCGAVKVLENVVATVNGELFESIEEAFAATDADETLILMADVSVAEAVMRGTLNLNGYTLTAEEFTSAIGDGNVIDTSANSAGKLVAENISLSDSNTYLPITMDDGVHFCAVDFTQWVEPVDNNTTKVKFYFTQRAAETIIDDAVAAGNTEVSVKIRLTWTDGSGTDQDRTYLFTRDLLEKYAEKWNSRVFVTTIGGTSGVTNLTCAYQVSSTASTGVTRSAVSISTPGYINEKLSWEAINSYPIKRSDMTVEEMRQLCVDFMEFTKTYLWTPSESVDFVKNASGSKDSMSQGTIYGGLPYVGVASGNPYRMMDYINEYGILDMKKALPALGTKDRLAMSDLKYFGSQCSESVYWGWGRVMNSANYTWTSNCVSANGFVLLGGLQMDESIKGWTASYNTDMFCAANGEQAMYKAYAECQKADGMVYYIEASDGDGAGHLVMVYTDAVVVYNGDGTINGEESYLTIIDQAQTWQTETNASGDTYKRKSSIGLKKTFVDLFEAGYVPFTFKEFLGEDPIEVTEVSLQNSKGATLVSGTVSEADQSFEMTKNTTTLTWSGLMGSSVVSNYGIVDVYVIFYDVAGNEIYRHAVRTGTAGNKKLSMAQSGASVTVWETKELQSGKTYRASIEVQLATGERPTIWNGKLNYEK